MSPATNIQSAIKAGGNGATFCFASGTYDIETTLRPLPNQKFVAVERRQAVLTGNNVTNMAFNGDGASSVEVRGLVIRDFNVTQEPGWGALKGSSGWLIVDNEVAHNNGLGIYHGPNSTVRGNTVHHNAHVGLGGFKAHNSLIEGNEVYENGFNGLRDNAGSKWVGALNLTVRDNHYHHNYNNAIWLDADHVNSLIEGNVVTDNYGKGIHYEVSCSSVIRHNVVERNALVGVLIVASQNVDVYGNTIGDNGDDVEIWHQAQRGGENCAWLLENVRVHDNQIRVSQGRIGVYKYNVTDGDAIFAPGDDRVRFDHNSYSIVGIAKPFHFANASRTPVEWVGFGQDPNGTFG